MNSLEIFKALSNQTRIDILVWLKDPHKYFKPQEYMSSPNDEYSLGVCVNSIQEIANISQSTVSHYLDVLQKAGLVVAQRNGKWTYYKRNESTIKEFKDYLNLEL